MRHRGGGHCSAVAFEVDAPRRITVDIEPFEDTERAAAEANIRELPTA